MDEYVSVESWCLKKNNISRATALVPPTPCMGGMAVERQEQFRVQNGLVAGRLHSHACLSCGTVNQSTLV